VDTHWLISELLGHCTRDDTPQLAVTCHTHDTPQIYTVSDCVTM